ncbi:MAG: hypothetical protein U0031_22055 [Thermomicrobiales bacterium]
MDLVVPRSRSSFPQRILGALRLDAAMYAEIAADATATSQAAIVVAVVAMLRGCESVGILGRVGSQNFLDPGVAQVIVGFVSQSLLLSILIAGFGWVVYTGIFALSSPWLAGVPIREAYGRLLRTVGFAGATTGFGVLRLVPTVGPLLGFAVLIWTLAAVILAMRQAVRVTAGRAMLMVVIAAIVAFLIVVLLVLPFAPGAGLPNPIG